MNDYKIQLKDDLTTLQLHVNRKLLPFTKMYPKMERGTFYRRCAMTFDSLYKIPKDFPNHLRVGELPQQALYYSNLSKTVLLYHKGYSGSLLTSAERTNPPLLKALKGADEVLILEHKIELLRYLNNLMKEPTKASVEKIKAKQMPWSLEGVIKDHESRLLKLEALIKKVN